MTSGVLKPKMLCGLLKDPLLATRIAKAAKPFGYQVYHYDDAMKLYDHLIKEPPAWVFLDFDQCERGAFELLNKRRFNADLKKVVVIGYVSSQHETIKREAENSGCDRIYTKSKFYQELDDLLMRYSI